MHSFYLPENIRGNTVSITDAEQLHHLRKVLRLKIGEKVTIFDVEGNEYICTIAELDRQQAALHINERKPAPVSKLKLAVACAVPKQSRMDEIVDKLTQLGVSNIIPLVTERVIIKLEGTGQIRLERWRKIARNAAEQSHRNTLPLISAVNVLKEVLAQSKDYQMKLIPTLTGERKTLREVFAGSRPDSVLILIGPEGDFTPQEIQETLNAGFIPVSLGESVLRVDTAAIAAASYVKLALAG